MLVQLVVNFKIKNMCCKNNNNNNNPCGCKTTTDEIVYNGPELTCTGIKPCDTLSSTISNISNLLCSTELVEIIITNITNNINLYNQFTTIVNTVVECQTVLDCVNTTTTTTTRII